MSEIWWYNKNTWSFFSHNFTFLSKMEKADFHTIVSLLLVSPQSHQDSFTKHLVIISQQTLVFTHSKSMDINFIIIYVYNYQHWVYEKFPPINYNINVYMRVLNGIYIVGLKWIYYVVLNIVMCDLDPFSKVWSQNVHSFQL